MMTATARDTVTLRIPTSNLEAFATKFNTLRKAAEKNGVEAPTFVFGARETVKRDSRFGSYDVTFVNVDVAFDLISDGSGATFVAKIVDGEVTASPNAPEGTVRQYWGITDRCDACNQSRDRKVLHVVSDGRVLGSTCVKDVYGINPALVLGWLTFLTDSDLTAEEGGESEGRWNSPNWVPAEIILTVASAMCREFGWVSKSRATEFQTATAEYVTTYLFGKGLGATELRQNTDLLPEDETIAAECLTWLAEQDDDSDYIFKSQQVVKDGEMAARNVALIASLIASHSREKAKAAERAARAKAAAEARAFAADVPTHGERVEVAGQVISLKWHDNGYGTVRKAVILTDEGYKLWGSIPTKFDSHVEVGHRVEFMAALTPSDDDPQFGFYKRPTKFAHRES